LLYDDGSYPSQNDDEKALVAQLMQKARLIHDREMVAKTNEIKRVRVTGNREWSNYHLFRSVTTLLNNTRQGSRNWKVS